MNTITFLNPLLLWGLGLISIPVIIHLLFRRRFQRVEWAPMRYLKLTIQRNRRRIQVEQLLLLLLRIAVVAVLFLLVARPVLHISGFESWMGNTSRTSKILVLDDSLSMGLLKDGQPVFDRARKLVEAIASDSGPQDRLTVVLASRPQQPLLHEVDMLDRQQLATMLGALQPTDRFVNWAATMKSVGELVTASTYSGRDVTLITDLRRAGWEQNLETLAAEWEKERVRLRILNVGEDAKHELALEQLKAEDSVAVAGAPARWDAVIRNNSDQNLERVEATVLIDGKPSVLSLPPLPVGQSITVPITATFQEPGLHHISLRLPDDDLPADNQRWSIVEVLRHRHVLLIDGQPASEPLSGAADFLAFALTSGGNDFLVDTLVDLEPKTLEGLQPDLMILADVASVTPAQAQRLRTLVEAGMGLVIFVGDQVDPDNYNQTFQRAGIDLLPAALERIDDEGANGLLLEENMPSALDSLRQLSPAVLARIRTKKFYQVQLPTADSANVRVLARWSNAAASPAAIERIVGRGRVVLWTTSANKAWTDWPVGPAAPAYVLGMRESAKALARRGAGQRDLTAGEPLEHPLAKDLKIRAPTIETPIADQPKSLSVESLGSGKGAANDKSPPVDLGLSYRETDRAGLYRMNWQAEPGGPQTDLFAVNPDARESNLAAISPGDLRALWGSLEPDVVSLAGAAQAASTSGEEIWRPLAICLLSLVLIEACFAAWAGRQR